MLFRRWEIPGFFVRVARRGVVGYRTKSLFFRSYVGIVHGHIRKGDGVSLG